MGQHTNVNILQNIMLQFAEDEMSSIWILQHDNDSKHIGRLAREWFRDNGIEVLD